MSEQRFVEMKEFDGFSDICDDGKVICSVRVEYAPKLVGLLNEQQATIQSLKEENEKLKNKLNVTALELVDEAISMGKAVEISEMNYPEFLEYRKKKGKPMELQR